MLKKLPKAWWIALIAVLLLTPALAVPPLRQSGAEVSQSASVTQDAATVTSAVAVRSAMEAVTVPSPIVVAEKTPPESMLPTPAGAKLHATAALVTGELSAS